MDISGAPKLPSCKPPPRAMAAAQDIYHKLDDSKHEIRLVRPEHHGHEDGLIRASLKIFSLDEQPEFNALSYAWTTHNPTREIRVGGMPFFIRPNLHDFFKILRNDTLNGWMFIDAICINQDDYRERAQQVQLMRRVYSEARRVVVWLGMPDEYDCFAKEVSRMAVSDATAIYSGLVLHTRSDNSSLGEALMERVQYSIFKWEYWSRVWIIQELLLAQDLVFLVGNVMLFPSFVRASIPDKLLSYRKESQTSALPGTEALFAHFSLLQSHGHRADLGWRLARTCLIVDRLLQHTEHSDRNAMNDVRCMPLTQALCLTFGQECTRSLDRVFGILGLTDSALEVDYRMSRMELFARTLVDCAIEIDLLRLQRKSEEEASMFDWHILRLSLAQGFRFQYPDILAHLVSIMVFDKFSAPRSPSAGGYWSLFKLASRGPNSTNIAFLKTALTRVRLWWYNSTNRQICDIDVPTRTKSYKEWVGWADAIARDQVSKSLIPWYDKVPR